MKQLSIILIEFILIITIVFGIYYVNLSRKESLTYKYEKPLISTHLNPTDLQLKEELIFFLSKEMGLFNGEFEIISAVFLYTQELSGSDYILVTLKAYDGRLFQITLSRNILPWARWQLNQKDFTIIEPLKPLIDYSFQVPEGLRDLGVTQDELDVYLSTHPEVAMKGESAFLDEQTGKYNLPKDWYQTVFSLVMDKDKTMRLISNREEKAKVDLINSYWKADYPRDYIGPGYRDYLYEKIMSQD